MALNKYKATLRQIVYFVVVGSITLGIDVGVSSALFYIAHLPAYLASAIGFCSGFFFNFPMNRKRVFHHSEADRFSLKVQASMYIMLSIFNLGATSLLVELLVTLHIVEIQVAKLLVTALIAIWNFILFKYFIFSKSQTAKPGIDRSQTY